ncbi:hypothetical protein DP113_10335 [Brasilonema octagenarum UFV-E1]|uniref:Uncharacterized protein n=1 Tax=Brasilonema sennae CENA114 TaxID=415709 RepID=A0A856MC44_9CYAN|nr:hypothetical protein DP114_10390 [Brasilonema sennae CENA114]QDL14614.1 hypothetical protein DP113_10335 [Brasilonema octagenarum UFV-E1]
MDGFPGLKHLALGIAHKSLCDRHLRYWFAVRCGGSPRCSRSVSGGDRNCVRVASPQEIPGG